MQYTYILKGRFVMQKWIIPCNPKCYDVIGVFKATKQISRKQSVDVQIGDSEYIYVGKPVSSILYKIKSIKVNLPKLTINDNEFFIDGSNYGNYG